MRVLAVLERSKDSCARTHGRARQRLYALTEAGKRRRESSKYPSAMTTTVTSHRIAKLAAESFLPPYSS